MQILIKKNNINNNGNIKEFYNITKDLIHNPIVQQMKNYRQHYDSSCYEHCIEVAYWSYLYCKKHNLDYIAIARAAILHDLFLYDWRHSRKKLGLNGFHAFVHPQIALNNALKICDLSQKEQDIILKHMWPITVIPPKSMEAFIITFVDKYCALLESYVHYKQNRKLNLLYRYAYVFLSFLVIKIM